MKHKDEFINAMNGLLHSWGSDTPPEAIWGLNELVDWAEKEYNVTINNRFSEPYEDNPLDPDVVIDEITSKL